MNIEDLTTFERWQYLAAFLPFVVAFFIKRGWTKEAQSRIAIAAYVIWGLFGALISGEFVGLTFDTAINVADSIMKVIIVGFVSYQTLWKAFPLPDKLEEATGGDPLVQVVPNKNVVTLVGLVIGAGLLAAWLLAPETAQALGQWCRNADAITAPG